MKKISLVLASSAFLALGLAPVAKGGQLFVPGSTFTDAGGDSPSTFSVSLTLTPGTTSPASGLDLTISEVFSGSDEWLIFDYQTATPGTQLVPSTSDDWSIAQTGLDLAGPANFIAAFAEFLDSSGNPITPTSAIFPGYSVMANPVPGGVGTGEGTTFVAPVPAGPLPDLGAFIDPFDSLDSTGVPSASVEGFYQALEFAPAATTPEPASVVMLGVGLLGMGLLRLRKRA